MIESVFVKRTYAAIFALSACVLVASSGCSAAWQGGGYKRTEARKNPFAEAPTGPDQSESKTEEEALADVFDELQEIGEIDPQAREKLTSDLRSVKPEHWPLMVQNFKSALAYQRQIAPRGANPSADRYTLAEPPTLPGSEATTPAAGLPPAEDQTQRAGEPPAMLISDTRSEHTLAQAAGPLPNSPPGDEQNVSAVPMAHDAAVQTASYASTAPPTGNWRDELESAILKLEESVSASPGSTDEVHEQMRLRLLYMLAGRQSDAMSPVQGAVPAQQDYWSKQLFALSSLLDNRQQPDDKQRAAGSLIHLDHARAKLAELATLQVRNLTFVESVDGYGVYERRQQNEFRPGDPVILYAEVENFRSDSSQEGYRTALSTSYEVVDSNGQRVDGQQFPDVEDICQNQRRDFHMQYGVSLPTRIYPGDYQLRLTITDQLSHKIGQASVPFVIVE